MTPDTVVEELNAFAAEYSPYLKSVEIMPKDASAQFITRENQAYTVIVSDAGWQCEQEYYATAQELLSAKSPAFIKEWGARLLDELQGLADSQLQEDIKHDDITAQS